MMDENVRRPGRPNQERRGAVTAPSARPFEEDAPEAAVKRSALLAEDQPDPKRKRALV